jgi:hypothetical protein
MSERLYSLLPAHHRRRDVELGGPLRALLAIIETELGAVEADADGAYDDAFIETCSEAMIPYIGDLLGVRLPHVLEGTTVSLRGYVANTIGYRRRKGTAAVLEQLASDVLGWPARVVEFFRVVTATQHLQHVVLERRATADLRDGNAMELLAGPFATTARSVDVRRIETDRGKHNLPNVGLYVWRLGAFPVTGATAGTRASLPPGYYTFDPAGADTPLFHRGEAETTATHIAEEWNVPGPLRRRALYEELTARATDADAAANWLGPAPAFRITRENADGTTQSYDWTALDIAHLGDPPAGDFHRPAAGRVAVDPELGRIALPDGDVPKRVSVDYSYGAPGEVGAGSYDRADAVREFPADAAFQREVAGEGNALDDAIHAWNQWARELPSGGDAAEPARTGIIAIADDQTRSTHRALHVPSGTKLILVAARLAEDGTGLDAQGLRPLVRGRLMLEGTAAPDATPGEVVIDGLWLGDGIEIAAGNLGAVSIGHTTLAPQGRGIVVKSRGAGTNGSLVLDITRSMCGALVLAPTTAALSISDSFVTGKIDADGTDATITAVTVLGATSVRTLECDGSIFVRRVDAARKQEGCVRMSFVPRGSRTPRRYRCQPDLALAAATTPADRRTVLAAMVPRFTSLDWPHPAFGQLAATCPVEIRRGADDGEMGCYRHLMAPQREANLRAALDEYLRFGLEAGIFYAT